MDTYNRISPIPFDLKYRPEIESGKYKVVAGEKLIPARIICWDARGAGGNHIVAMVGYDGEPENIQRYYDNGHLIADSANRGTKDLYIIPDGPIELSESENEIRCALIDELTYHSPNGCSSTVFIDDFTASRIMKRVKEILKKHGELEVPISDAAQIAWAEGNDRGYKDGKEDAEMVWKRRFEKCQSYLCMWHIWIGPDDISYGNDRFIIKESNGNIYTSPSILRGQTYMYIDDLLHLPSKIEDFKF